MIRTDILWPQLTLTAWVALLLFAWPMTDVAADSPASIALRDGGVVVGSPVGRTALHDAVSAGDRELVARLIHSGEDVSAVTLYGMTPVQIAVASGRVNLLNDLLDAGADCDRRAAGGETLLMLAARSGDLAVVESLLSAGADPQTTGPAKQTPLMWAAERGHGRVVRRIVKTGVPIDARSQSGMTALMFAARQGRSDAVETLIALGADVDSVSTTKNRGGRKIRGGTSALLLAVQSGHFEVAMTLVDAGADPTDMRSGVSPLHAMAAVRKANRGDDVTGDPTPRGSGNLTSLEFAKALVAAGADVNAALQIDGQPHGALGNRGSTPFLFACRTADLPLMQTLVSLGADPGIANHDGTTPLMAAAGVGVRAVDEEAGTEAEVVAAVEYLLDLGADVNAVDQRSETAMHGAAYRCFPEVVHTLSLAGADPQVWDRKNWKGWTPTRIAMGYRFGSFKPHPPTIAALDEAKQSASHP